MAGTVNLLGLKHLHAELLCSANIFNYVMTQEFLATNPKVPGSIPGATSFPE
jgi:hypothetical protein